MIDDSLISGLYVENTDLEKLEKTVQKFDEWFRYAEQIGQQRLGSYFFGASIMLGAFTNLYSKNIFLLSIYVALFGVVFSLAWFVLARKIHQG